MSDISTKARAEAFNFLSRCIKDPSQMHKAGFKTIEAALSFEEKRIANLEKRA